MTGNQAEKPENAEIKRYDALAPGKRIPEMVERIVREFDPQKIILFGSHARGDANRWSDIDLLVVFEQIEDQRKMRVAIRRALRDVHCPEDIIESDFNEISMRGEMTGSVLRPALREDCVVYERCCRMYASHLTEGW